MIGGFAGKSLRVVGEEKKGTGESLIIILIVGKIDGELR